jgi:ribosome-associated protein
MHRLEATRERLLADTDAAMSELIEQFPSIDRQHLRSLVRQAKTEKESNKPPRAYREIFQLLKELAPGDEDTEQGDLDDLEEQTP